MEYRVMLSAMTLASAEVVAEAENEEEARAKAIEVDGIEWQAGLGEERDIEVDEVELIGNDSQIYEGETE